MVQVAALLRSDLHNTPSVESIVDSQSHMQYSTSPLNNNNNINNNNNNNFPNTANVEHRPLSDLLPQEFESIILNARTQQGSELHLLDHRPDSPTSLEDSQSESGLDPYSNDTTDTEQSNSRFSSNEISADPNTFMNEHSKIIHEKLANSHNAVMSPSQVVTPPLSPIKIPVQGIEEMNESHDELYGEISGTEDELTTLSLLDPSKADTLQDDDQSQSECSTITTTTTTSSSTLPSDEMDQNIDSASAIASSAPSPSPSAPKASAWSNLLPGVAPIPVNRSQPFAKRRVNPNTRRSNDLRLHERFPIVLSPEIEAKLSMDMVDLFESLLPTEESHELRTRLIKKIEDILHEEWPEHDIQVHPFGSTVNDLGTSSSDLDICLMTKWKGLDNVQIVADTLRKYGMDNVFCVPRAKVPIVKLWDPELQLACDININTPLGLMNSNMIKTYVSIDPRVRPFAMIIKHWARRRVLNDAANGGTISTYAWICMVINFLQMRSPPILPVLHKVPHNLSDDNQVVNGNNTSFCQDLEQLEGFGLPNKETLGGLLYAFFRRFAIEFDYDNYVVSIREGCYLTKESKNWHVPGKQYKMLCIEEPFDTSRNLGNSADMMSCKGLKEEFKRALTILYNKGSLNECCEQFVFPSSYYYVNNNTWDDCHGVAPSSRHNYAPGRRYTNGYKSYVNYYDDDYDDDEEEDHVKPDISVMETLNIGTRSHSSIKNLSARYGSENKELNGGLCGGNGKSPSSSKDGSPSRHSRSRSRSKGKTNGGGEKNGAKGSPPGTGSTKPRSSKQEKSGTTGSSGQRSKKTSGSSNSKQKGGRGGNGGNNATGSNGNRVPRAAVEFSLAEIANVAPKLLSASTSSDLEGSPQMTSGDGVDATTNKKKGGKKNVVWSTNSNRGESVRRQPKQEDNL
ncbi:hypothetical protein BGZ76_001631 [Entomortierella beljakovae]|nr:hypothetical protein BGZ76_001631 [Entomortierella beljakovae]